ncbi:MAG TPA: TIGR00730 family Rossman fold protein [Methylibium sp.]|uniref:LOG family protein n=1 Tax=Methylibium sp. TaxID=2067992 RepID=UPI002DB6D7FF|nr:TIGR00730 family Rossman fold protein [Methylibium sp.]HEU4460326.1 TIGR00730 family Rossman fold protein [Methylibium sp.]
MKRRPFTVCVYCGSRHGKREAFAEAARSIGRLIGERGWAMVYGGGRVGLMGEAADAALSAGAEVVGVLPHALAAREVGHLGLTRLELVDSMHLRKQRMAELSDAFVALPGGIGTMDELFEIWTWRQLGLHAKPIGLLDVDGYYEPLLAMLRSMVERDFLGEATASMLMHGTDAAALLDRLAAAR